MISLLLDGPVKARLFRLAARTAGGAAATAADLEEFREVWHSHHSITHTHTRTHTHTHTRARARGAHARTHTPEKSTVTYLLDLRTYLTYERT